MMKDENMIFKSGNMCLVCLGVNFSSLGNRLKKGILVAL